MELLETAKRKDNIILALQVYAAVEEMTDEEAEAVSTTAETLATEAMNAAAAENGLEAEGGEEDDDMPEVVDMNEKLSYLAPLLRLLTMFHLFVSFSILVAYYQLKVSHLSTQRLLRFFLTSDFALTFLHLAKCHNHFRTSQVPLVLFKREKEVCRNLEFEGKWIAEQPSDDDIMGHWDKIVISAKSFPDKYWDKFVKKKVTNWRLPGPL